MIKYKQTHRGWYKGYWCDSSWELAVVMYCLDNHIQIIRNTKTFKYLWRQHYEYYKPDFIIAGKYVQIKGIKDYRSKKKITCFPYPITFIGSKQIKIYIDYAKKNYGDDFWRLLEK